MLKALEEPPPNTRWLLVTAQPERLLPTIRSRAEDCAATTWPGGGEHWLRAQGVAAGDIDALLARTRGAPLDALSFARSESGARWRTSCTTCCVRVNAHAPVGAWVESGAKADRRERFTTMLRLLLDWTSDWSRTRASLPPLVYLWPRPGTGATGAGIAGGRGTRYHRRCCASSICLTPPLSARLQLESILLDYRALFRDRTLLA